MGDHRPSKLDSQPPADAAIGDLLRGTFRVGDDLPVPLIALMMELSREREIAPWSGTHAIVRTGETKQGEE